MDQNINSSHLNFEPLKSPDLCIGRISCFDGILHQNCVGLSATNMKLHVVHDSFFRHLSRLSKVKWSASSRWSFGPNSAWGSIETTTARKKHYWFPLSDNYYNNTGSFFVIGMYAQLFSFSIVLILDFLSEVELIKLRIYFSKPLSKTNHNHGTILPQLKRYYSQ